MNTNYTPGPWLGIVRSDTVIVLDENTQPEIVLGLWEFLGKKPQIHEVLNKVTASFGTELTGMPSFGILTIGEHPRAVLRGDMSLTVRTGNAELEVSGREVTTWSERSLPAADLFTLRLGEARDDALRLPLAEGVVQLSGLQLGEARADLLAGSPNDGQDRVVPETPTAALETPSHSQSLIIPESTEQPEQNQAEVPPLVVPLSATPSADLATSSEPVEQNESAVSPESPEPEAPQAAVVEGASAAELDLSQTLVSSEISEENEAETASPAELDVEAIDQGPAAAPLSSTAPATAPDVDEPLFIEAPDNTTSYDHLWDRTVSRSVEDAAIRAEESEEEAAAEQAEEVAEPLQEAVEPPSQSPQTPFQSEPASVAPQETPYPTAEPVLGAAPLGGGLIDSVPWLKAGNQPTPSPEQAAYTPPSVPTPAPSSPLSAPSAPASQESQPQSTDHDGQTVMRSELEVPQPPITPPQGSPAEPATGTGAMVLARLCGNGHANPPTYARCAQCGQPMMGDAFQVRRPVLGQMRISSGEVIDLDRSLIIGRQPSVSRVNGEGMPKLIQVRSQAGDISRSHVEIRLEGWDVVLVDLKATNGTVLVREGQPPRRLGQGEQALLLNGDIAELGEDVSLRFEGLL